MYTIKKTSFTNFIQTLPWRSDYMYMLILEMSWSSVHLRYINNDRWGTTQRLKGWNPIFVQQYVGLWLPLSVCEWGSEWMNEKVK